MLWVDGGRLSLRYRPNIEALDRSMMSPPGGRKVHPQSTDLALSRTLGPGRRIGSLSKQNIFKNEDGAVNAPAPLRIMEEKALAAKNLTSADLMFAENRRTADELALLPCCLPVPRLCTLDAERARTSSRISVGKGGLVTKKEGCRERQYRNEVFLDLTGLDREVRFLRLQGVGVSDQVADLSGIYRSSMFASRSAFGIRRAADALELSFER
jgi:hypothetical protein